MPEPTPVWPVWNSAGSSRFGDRLVEHIGAAVVGIEPLHRGMKLEAANAEARRSAGAPRARPPCLWPDRCWRTGSARRYWRRRSRRPPRWRSGGSRSRARRRPERSPRRFCARDSRPRFPQWSDGVRLLEIIRHRGLQFVVAVIGMRAAGLFARGYAHRWPPARQRSRELRNFFGFRSCRHWSISARQRTAEHGPHGARFMTCRHSRRAAPPALRPAARSSACGRRRRAP